MKKQIFGALLALTVVACGSDETSTDSNVDTQAVKQIEAVTEEVTQGTQEMEEEIDNLGGEIDELLNDI